MIFKKLKHILFWSLIACNLFFLSSAFAQSSVVVKLTENDLNKAVNNIKLSGSERKKFESRFLPDISVTADWKIEDLRLDIKQDEIIVKGKVRVKDGGDALIPFSYTNDFSSTASTKIDGNELFINVSSLKIPIYVKNPFNRNKVEITKIDLANYLQEDSISVDLPFQDDYTINIPEGGKKKLVLGNKNLQIDNDYILVTGEFSISDF
ncbi:MAG: hypothetical protein AAGE84_09190 [Cyanobacteria bacterium P01_G01_bin.39]